MADDTDIFVLLCHYTNCQSDLDEQNNICLDRVLVGQQYDVSKTVEAIPHELLGSILLAHAFTGCDTVSTIYRMGKIGILKRKIISNEMVQMFYDQDTPVAEICKAGEDLMMKLYTNGRLKNIIMSTKCDI